MSACHFPFHHVYTVFFVKEILPYTIMNLAYLFIAQMLNCFHPVLLYICTFIISCLCVLMLIIVGKRRECATRRLFRSCSTSEGDVLLHFFRYCQGTTVMDIELLQWNILHDSIITELINFSPNFFCIKEYNKHDKEPSKYIKQWKGIKPKTGAPYSCDIGYERFMGPEVLF